MFFRRAKNASMTGRGAQAIRPVWMHGYLYGLRHSCLRARVRFPRLDSQDTLGHIDRNLTQMLEEAGLATSGAWPSFREAGVEALPEALLAWVAAIQEAAGSLAHARGISIDARLGVEEHTLAIPCMLSAYPETLDMLNWLLSLLDFAANARRTDEVEKRFPKVLQRLRDSVSKTHNIPPFLRAADALGIPYGVLPGGVIQFGHGARARWLDSTFTDETGFLGTRIAQNKHVTGEMLRQAGIPIPPRILVESQQEALVAAEKLGYPVVVKPIDRDGGVGVSADLRDSWAVKTAYASAAKLSRSVLVEKHITGKDYRLTVHKDELVSATERVPGGVVGDGSRTVRELMEEVNRSPWRSDKQKGRLKKLTLDAEAHSMLEQVNLDPDAIPARYQFVRLRRTANISQGGEPINVIERVHDDNRLLAIRAAATLRLDLAGIDLIMPDIQRSWLETGAVICEVNARPHIGVLTNAHVYPLLLRRLVPGDGRIPVIMVLGARPDQSLLTGIAGGCARAGVVVGIANSHGVGIGERQIARGPLNPFEGGRALLRDHDVTGAVIFVNDTTLLDTGLPCDRYDALLLAGSFFTDSASGREQDHENRLPGMIAAILPACSGRILTVEHCGIDCGTISRDTSARLTDTPIKTDELVVAIVAEILLAEGKHGAFPPSP
jgi:cyanophycin synthetase